MQTTHEEKLEQAYALRDAIRLMWGYALSIPRCNEHIQTTFKDLEEITAATLTENDPDFIKISHLIHLLRCDVFARDIVPGSFHGLTLSEVRELQALKHEAVLLRNQFVTDNIPLVKRQVAKYRTRKNNPRLDYNDLLQEGCLGLMSAVCRFKPELGFKFSTYSHMRIWVAIDRYASIKIDTVYKPSYIIDLKQQMYVDDVKTYTATGQTRSIAEQAKRLATKEKHLKQAAFHSDSISLDELKTLQGHEPASDIMKTSGEFKLIQESRITQMKNVLKLLAPIEQDIIRRRYGFHGKDPETLNEVAKLYQFTREHIRQIQQRAEGKLKTFMERRGA